MVKLDRYIGSSVLLAIVAVLGIIVGLALLFAFIDELNYARTTYNALDVLGYVLMGTPQQIYEMLPMAALIGCLIGLGTLASNSELTIMRASGVSLARIVWAVMKPMLLLLTLSVLIGEYVTPWAADIAQSHRAQALGSGQAQTGKHGVWHRQGAEYVHINAVQTGGGLLGVTRYRFDDQRRLQTASFARSGQYRDGYWELRDVATTQFGERETQVLTSATERWDVELTPQLLGTVVMDPDALSISGLWRYARYLNAQGLNGDRYWLAFWVKVLQPLVTAALVLMAISFIFGPLRSVTLGQRIFTGVLVGFVFRIAQDLLGPSSLVFGFSPLLAVLLPASVCAGAGFWLLRRAG